MDNEPAPIPLFSTNLVAEAMSKLLPKSISIVFIFPVVVAVKNISYVV